MISANAEDGGDEKEIRKVADNHLIINPIWSPDGKNIAFISSQTTEKGRIWGILEIPSDGGEPREIVASRKGKIHIFDWSRDGKKLIICADPNDSQQSQLWVAAYPNGEMTRLTNDILTYQGANLSADGNSILTIQKELTGDLFYMNYSLLQNTERLTETQSFMGRFRATTDNRILAEINENGRRGLAFVGTDGSNLQPLFPQSANEQSPSVSPDEKKYLLRFDAQRNGGNLGIRHRRTQRETVDRGKNIYHHAGSFARQKIYLFGNFRLDSMAAGANFRERRKAGICFGRNLRRVRFFARRKFSGLQLL